MAKFLETLDFDKNHKHWETLSKGEKDSRAASGACWMIGLVVLSFPLITGGWGMGFRFWLGEFFIVLGLWGVAIALWHMKPTWAMIVGTITSVLFIGNLMIH